MSRLRPHAAPDVRAAGYVNIYRPVSGASTLARCGLTAERDTSGSESPTGHLVAWRKDPGNGDDVVHAANRFQAAHVR